MMIKCNGQVFNPCKGLSEAEARAAFEMYASVRPANSYTWTLHDDAGKVVEERTSPTVKGAKK
jgi:hypothetical protein